MGSTPCDLGCFCVRMRPSGSPFLALVWLDLGVGGQLPVPPGRSECERERSALLSAQPRRRPRGLGAQDGQPGLGAGHLLLSQRLSHSVLLSCSCCNNHCLVA